jgi:uncharacterized protein (DUF2147 family)
MMRNLLLAAAVILAQSIASFAFAQTSIEGVWRTEGGRSTVQISRCGESFCGVVTSVAPRADGAVWHDVHNPDPAFRQRTMEGVQILSDLRVRGQSWAGGRIYNPADGRTYDARARLTPNGALRLEGCVAVFCRAQVWTRIP